MCTVCKHVRLEKSGDMLAQEIFKKFEAGAEVT